MANQHAKNRTAPPVAFLRCPVCAEVAEVYQRAGSSLRYWSCGCGTLQPFKAPGQAYIDRHAVASREAVTGTPAPVVRQPDDVQPAKAPAPPPAPATPPPATIADIAQTRENIAFLKMIAHLASRSPTR